MTSSTLITPQEGQAASPALPAGRAPRADVTDRVKAWLGLLPYVLFVGIFLVVPIVMNVWTSLHNADGDFTFETLAKLGESQYASAFWTTIRLAAVTAILGGIGGLIVAWAIATIERPRWLRSFMLSFTVVASQQGGIPLAFAFIATIGTQGMLTVWLRDSFGWNLNDVLTVSSFNGLVLVYLYFQIPLMAVLMLPAVLGIRPQWRESAVSLGASRIRYMWDVILPILTPSIGGSLLLLFANAFAAYATAYALAGSGANLVPILIGFFISGNVMSDETMGAALVTGMIAVITIAMFGRGLLVRRSTRWLR